MPQRTRAEISLMNAASRPRPIRDRILLVAGERHLPRKDVARALKASSSSGDYLIDFALAHGINLDWLIFGDIRGLLAVKRLELANC